MRTKGKGFRVLMMALLLSMAMMCMAETAAPEYAQGAEALPPELDAEMPAADAEPFISAKGYVLVTTYNAAGWLALPEEGETSWPIRQILPDGSEMVNTVHLTPEGMYMEDSTCSNHDCVDQGMVTFENRDERILGNMIICLPNQVVLYLYSPEEVQALVEEGMPFP